MTKIMMPDQQPNAQRSRARRLLRRLFLGLIALVLVLVAFVAVSIIVDNWIGQDATDFTNVSYAADDGTELHAYLAQPAGDGPFPAVVMFHEWWGLNEDIVRLADTLAQEGYVVLAPDAYRGESTGWIPTAVWLVTNTDQEQIADDVDQGFDYLINLDGVDSERVGTVGFCFGGRQSFWLGWRQRERVDAVVSLYGTTYTEREQLENFDEDVPILAIYGAEDNSIAVDDARAMDALMDEVGLQHTVSIYDGVGHAFVSSDNIDEPGAAADAWNEMLTFFERHLKGEQAEARPETRRAPLSSVTSTDHFICLVP